MVFVFDHVMHETALYRWIDNGIMNYYYYHHFICDAYTSCGMHPIKYAHTHIVVRLSCRLRAQIIKWYQQRGIIDIAMKRKNEKKKNK